jgi:hypothetical protein
MSIAQIQVTNGTSTIKVIDESTDEKIKEEGYFKYEKSEIPKELIDDCERLANETNKTHFIFDTNISSLIKRKSISSTEDKRESKLFDILEENTYHIGTEEDFYQMPSRFSYYDTETKLSCRYEKYKMLESFLFLLGFEPSEFNLGSEMEQSYIFKINVDNDFIKFIIRVKPNLFIDILSEGNGTFSKSGYMFFSKSKILSEMEKFDNINIKSIIRDVKIKILLEK